MTTAAIIVAGGRGARFGSESPKQYQPLLGQPLLRRTVVAFLDHPRVDRVQVVIRREDRALYDAAVLGLDLGLGLAPPVIGGATRQASVAAGLEAVAGGDVKQVLIHDAARPLVSAALIDRVLAALADTAGALPALPVADSLRRVEQGAVAGTVARDNLVRAQTPQGFRLADILKAHRTATDGTATDDAELMQGLGGRVAVVAGDEDNFKVTEAEDLMRAERTLLARLSDIRTGSGFDVHRFGPGDHVMLGGVRIAHGNGLVGHSDADAALHALTDAILGALAEGDIGAAFPPSDARWRNADSALFLKHAGERVAARGGIIAHLDLTIICEAPKIGPHRDAMRARIAEILSLAPDRVSVKATTTEKLGFTGRAEGLAAEALATVRLP